MDWYSIIKDSYNKGHYTPEQVRMFADKGKITKKQAGEILM